MRGLLSVLLIFVCVFAANSQPWMENINGRVRFEDIVSRYQRVDKPDNLPLKDVNGNEVIREDENYHFDRWSWYWQQHLDTAGYMVHKSVARRNWFEYLATHQPQGAVWKTTAASDWQFEGPSTAGGGYSGLGRINVIGFDPVDSNTMYVGSAGGGTWKTTNGGETWKCLYDHMFSTGVSDIKVNPLNRNTVYVATGDANSSDNYSVGVIKSYDGGDSWINIGPNWTPDSFVLSKSFLINPLDTNHITLGTSKGVYKSGDGGATWVKTSSHKIRQMLYNALDTALVYASIDGGTSAQIITSNDGGYTWTEVTSFTNATRINISVTPDAPHIVRAVVAKKSTNGLIGIYNSVDYGASFTASYSDNGACTRNLLSNNNEMPTTTCKGQGWYDLCIATNPADKDKVIIGGIVNYYSTNGGANWDIVNQWYNEHSDLTTVHADKHWLGYNELNGALYLGCDGGIYKTYDPASGFWRDLSNGIGITQFYRNAVADGVDFCLGGAQDNGTKKLLSGTVEDLTGGDGMQCLFDYSDPEYVYYTSTQNGNVRITVDGGISFTSITSDLPTPGAWITPYLIHPTNPNILFIGYKRVFKSFNQGATWISISSDFSTNNILFMAIAPTDPNYIYASRNISGTSRINYTQDGGATWDVLSVPVSNYVSDITVDPLNEKRIYVTFSGYNSAKVYSYNVESGLWTNETGGLPDLPVNCIVIDKYSQTQYIGNDAGVFYRDTASADWKLFNTNLPTVQVRDLSINYRNNEIWAATYGRGMWKSNKYDISPTSVGNVVSFSGKALITPNPAHGSFSIDTRNTRLRGQRVTVRLMSVDGKRVLEVEDELDGRGTISINAETVPPGFYLCEVFNQSGHSRGKVVID